MAPLSSRSAWRLAWPGRRQARSAADEELRDLPGSLGWQHVMDSLVARA